MLLWVALSTSVGQYQQQVWALLPTQVMARVACLLKAHHIINMIATCMLLEEEEAMVAWAARVVYPGT